MKKPLTFLLFPGLFAFHRDNGAGSQGGQAEKTPEEILESIEKAQQAFKEAIDKKADSGEIEKLKAEIETLKTQEREAILKEQKELREILKTQGETITLLKEGNPTPAEKGFKTLREALTHEFTKKGEDGKSLHETMKEIHAKGGKMDAPIQLKVAVVMGEDNTIGAGATQNVLTQNTGIISTIRRRELRYLANVSVGNIGTQYAMWIEEHDEQGTPIMLGEGDTKTQLSVLYKELREDVKKIAVFGKVTTEMMADLPQLISYVQNNMMRRMDIVVENQLFSGDGTGDNLAGLEEYATAFNAGDLAGTVVGANEIDVFEAIANQVQLAFGASNAIFIHPTTMSKMKLIKDDNGRPIWKEYVTITGDMVISGQRIIPTTAVTAGSFIGGELPVVNVLFREEMAIQIGLSGTDFVENKKTMLAEKRLVQFVSANDTGVLVQGTFADAIADLNEAPAA